MIFANEDSFEQKVLDKERYLIPYLVQELVSKDPRFHKEINTLEFFLEKQNNREVSTISFKKFQPLYTDELTKN